MNCTHCGSVINDGLQSLREGLYAYQAFEYAKAFQLLLPHAEMGSATAQCLVGSIYQLSLGVPPNGAEAVTWYLRAGQQGCGLAYHNLATLYAGTMPDVSADPKKPKECLRIAAELGCDMFPQAQQDAD